MEKQLSSAENESWQDRVDRDAREIIATVDTHDAFMDAMAKGMAGKKLFYRQKGFNSFVSRLSTRQGYILNMLMQLAQAKGVCTEEDMKLMGDLFHAKVHALLQGEALQNAGLGSLVPHAQKELNLRMESQEVEMTGRFPSYCMVGNPELGNKYRADDLQAKEFVFQCAKKLILAGAKFYEDIWQ